MFEQQNIEKNHLPQLHLNGQASYQSDITKVPLPLVSGFDMPAINKDCYKINIELDELLWDGGFTKEQESRAAGRLHHFGSTS